MKKIIFIILIFCNIFSFNHKVFNSNYNNYNKYINYNNYNKYLNYKIHISSKKLNIYKSLVIQTFHQWVYLYALLASSICFNMCAVDNNIYKQYYIFPLLGYISYNVFEFYNIIILKKSIHSYKFIFYIKKF